MDRVEIRVCSGSDLAHLVSRGEPAEDLAHHRERFTWQERGQAWYLLAWRDGVVAGRVTLLRESKYAAVRARYGNIWEMNALEAVPQGTGTGTRLITAAEQKTAAEGPAVVGLAFEPSNLGALRLYERLGYRDWGHGPVLDEWTERDPTGAIIREHRTECRYLTKQVT